MARQTDAQHHTQIVGMKVIAWNDHWTDGNDAHWENAHQEFDDVSQDSTDDVILTAPSIAGAPATPSQQPSMEDILLQEAPQHIEPAYHHTLGQVQQMLEQRDSHHQKHYNHHAARHREGHHEAHMQQQWVHQ
jgi:hypothetical protein